MTAKILIGLVAGGLVVSLGTSALVRHVATRGVDGSRLAAPPRHGQATYSTKFDSAEDPVSEGGSWINGRADGLDWADVQTNSGYAFGTESGFKKYDDSTAILRGAWGPDQIAEATVRAVKPSDDSYEEVELRLRGSLSAHRSTGYEVNFRCSKTGQAYAQIVRWNGPLGSFTYLEKRSGAAFGVADGDSVKATIIGRSITAYINSRQVMHATDGTYSYGSPGIGFYFEGRAGSNADFGFKDFTATDGLTANGRPNQLMLLGLVHQRSMR